MAARPPPRGHDVPTLTGSDLSLAYEGEAPDAPVVKEQPTQANDRWQSLLTEAQARPNP